MATRHLLRLGLASALAAALAGCMAYSNVKRDTDRQPIVHTGVGATVLMPGQGAPSLPESVYGRGYGGAARPGTGAPSGPGAVPAPPGAGGATSGSYSGTGTGSSGGGSGYAAGPTGGGPYGAAPSASNIQFIGGAEIDEVKHREIKQEPLIIKSLLAPVAAVAWPFKKAVEAVRGDPQPVVAPPAPQAPAPGPPDYEAAYEEQQLQALESQLGGAPAAAPPVRGAAPPGPAAPPRARPSSIADELAALQRRVPPRGVAPAPGGPAAGAAVAPAGVADRVSDDDGDGRPDQWQYRENGVLVRELFDQNGDGRVDRTVRYDPATGQKRSEEDDANQDGHVDSWVEYQGGQVVRRRQDTSGDGEPDVWTFYQGGQVARIEEDRDGDGFRDRVGYYALGKLQRESEDSNGDGRPDRITLYDGQERVRQRSEDRDGDGLVDARSFYENGKLVRKELVDEGAAGESLEEGLGTSGDFSDGSEPEPAPPRASLGSEG
jgi:antitoxin component YwqK of YwqJK toxin-antitoxin module